MGKATQKTSPANLGTKRNCPQCATKFYDFNKDEIVCPKCNTRVNPALNPSAAPEVKKPAKSVEKSAEETLGAAEEVVLEDGDDAFESIEEIEDEEDDLAEDIEVDGEETET